MIMEITNDLLRKCLPLASQANIDKYADAIRVWCKKFGINTPLRIAHFLAQVSHECGDFKYTHELGSSSYFKKYDTGRLAERLGNTPEEDGDGELYKGRGLIQITGKANYTVFSKWYFGAGPDEKIFVSRPELVEQSTPCVASAVWYWTVRNLNALADKDDVLTITKRINGGTNGLEDRKKRLAIIKKALGI